VFRVAELESRREPDPDGLDPNRVFRLLARWRAVRCPLQPGSLDSQRAWLEVAGSSAKAKGAGRQADNPPRSQANNGDPPDQANSVVATVRKFGAGSRIAARPKGEGTRSWRTGETQDAGGFDDEGPAMRMRPDGHPSKDSRP
jgi:hypothetical protein